MATHRYIHACVVCGRVRELSAQQANRIARGLQSGRCRPCRDESVRETDWRPRFWAKVAKTDGCWIWQAGRIADGYGEFKLEGKMRRAHVVAYMEITGPVPDGLELDHLCRNRACVNPAHLEPVTHAENMRRGHFANVTHCPAGHAYDEANTYRPPKGGRFCRLCNAAAQRRYQARKRAAA